MPENEIELIIEVLEEARLRSIDKGVRADIGDDPDRMRIVMDLIEEEMLWGKNGWQFPPNKDEGRPPDHATLYGIKLKGRRYLQELRDYKKDRGLRGRSGKAGWVIFGALIAFVAGLLGTYVTARLHLKDEPKQAAVPAAQVSPTSSP